MPHRLDLYRLAVQHPEAEVRFLLRACAHHNGDDAWPTRLKEDFAGTAAVAAAWVALDEDHRALAVESHGPTLRWAERRWRRALGERAQDLHLVEADVLSVDRPKVDLVAALNFSTFIYHDRAALHRYFRAARRSLRPGGVIVLDAYGGPGAERLTTQQRRVTPDPDTGVEPFDYAWEQRGFDALTRRTDCRIHFTLANGRRLASAFRYDWRLWTLPELTELLREAGFDAPTAWCDRYDAAQGTSDGLYRPITALPAREDWVAYVTARRP